LKDARRNSRQDAYRQDNGHDNKPQIEGSILLLRPFRTAQKEERDDAADEVQDVRRENGAQQIAVKHEEVGGDTRSTRTGHDDHYDKVLPPVLAEEKLPVALLSQKFDAWRKQTRRL
jgi:hypothetical protein